MSADEVFKWLVILTWPASVIYAAVMVVAVKWWRSEVGAALLISAVGLALVLTFFALFQWFGPNYWGRDVVRIGGMSLVFVGAWATLAVAGRILWRGRHGERDV